MLKVNYLFSSRENINNEVHMLSTAVCGDQTAPSSHDPFNGDRAKATGEGGGGGGEGEGGQ